MAGDGEPGMRMDVAYVERSLFGTASGGRPHESSRNSFTHRPCSPQRPTYTRQQECTPTPGQRSSGTSPIAASLGMWIPAYGMHNGSSMQFSRRLVTDSHQLPRLPLGWRIFKDSPIPVTTSSCSSPTSIRSAYLKPHFATHLQHEVHRRHRRRLRRHGHRRSLRGCQAGSLPVRRCSGRACPACPASGASRCQQRRC